MATGTVDQDTTQAAIMDATYRALCDHGYADLTIQKIADEFAKSKSLLYYHYDTKDEILIALLEYLLDQFTVEDAIDPTDDPETQLQSFVDNLMPGSVSSEEREFQTALLELRSQALSSEAYREQFTRADDFLRETVARILENGIDDGAFRDVAVDEFAESIVTTINGAMLQRATTNSEATVPRTRDELQTRIQSVLLESEQSG